MNFIEKLKGKKCLVIGAGITGMAVQKALSDFGAKVDIFDEKKVAKVVWLIQFPTKLI